MQVACKTTTQQTGPERQHIMRSLCRIITPEENEIIRARGTESRKQWKKGTVMKHPQFGRILKLGCKHIRHGLRYRNNAIQVGFGIDSSVPKATCGIMHDIQ